jgi:small subunit ribosomal protein S7
MPRRQYKKTELKPDLVYKNYEVTKLINYIMKDGKKSIAKKIVYEVLEAIKKESKDPIQTLSAAISNVSPNWEARPRRLGGASYMVPMEVRRERRLYLALNWIIDAATARPNKEFKTFDKKLLAELVEASQNQGEAVNKRLQTEKLAEANKAFAHLKW